MPAFLIPALRYWKLAAAGLLVAALLVQTIRLERSERRADRAEFNLHEAHQAVREAHEATLRAQTEVDKTLRQIEAMRKGADGKARTIENAPLPGNCRTPQSIMDLDI